MRNDAAVAAAATRQQQRKRARQRRAHDSSVLDEYWSADGLGGVAGLAESGAVGQCTQILARGAEASVRAP
jgi:hypothetical protein